MLAAIEAARAAMRSSRSGVLGIHLEGPYLATEHGGVHDADQIRPCRCTELSALLAAAEGMPTLMTLAPERVPRPMRERMLDAGWTLAAGHSGCSYEEAMGAFERGVRLVTHLWNAMSGLASRAPGLVGAALDNPTVHAGVIVDGHHLHDATVQLTKRLMGERLILVTDAMPPVGNPAPETTFTLGTRDIQYRAQHRAGRCETRRGRLAGSALDMATAVRNCVQRVGIALDEALRMAATYPAAAIGRERDLGRIAEGYRADLVVFDDEIRVEGVIIGGEYRWFRR